MRSLSGTDWVATSVQSLCFQPLDFSHQTLVFLEVLAGILISGNESNIVYVQNIFSKYGHRNILGPTYFAEPHSSPSGG